jgi:thiazole synthase ThiGH ThiG subunit
MYVSHDIQEDTDEPWLVLGKEMFRSRLLVGIEQYDSASTVRQVLEASGSDAMRHAVRAGLLAFRSGPMGRSFRHPVDGELSPR